MTEPYRLEHPRGTSGVLTAREPWSVEVTGVAGPQPAAWLAEAARWAEAQGAVDLRSPVPLPGTTPLGDGTAEHVLPVPLRLADASATRALGRRVASALRPGDLLVLSGPLGAGKTTFTQGVAEALGVRGRVTSPTFVLARMHRGPLPLVHVDAYRLRDSGAFDLDDLDLEAALEDAVTVVEWGGGIVEDLAESWLTVTLDRQRGDPADLRVATVVSHGLRWAVLP